MERKLEAAQETIVDQQQTIEKFRELVHNLTSDLSELRSKGERTGGESGGGGGGDGATQSQSAMMNINLQSKSAIKAQSRVRLLANNASVRVQMLMYHYMTQTNYLDCVVHAHIEISSLAFQNSISDLLDCTRCYL